MFEFSVSKDMKSMLHRKRGGSKEGSGTFMSNINCQGIEISVEQGRVVTTLYIIFSVIMWPRASCLSIYVYTALGREISLS